MNDDQTTNTAAGPDRYLALARDAFTGSTTFFDSSIRPQIESAIRQFQGIHPTNSKYHSDAYRSRSRLFRPKTRATIRKNEASAAEAFFATADVVTVTPEDPDDPKQRASASVKHALLNYRLKKSIPWFVTLIGAYQDAQNVGVCLSYEYWKYDAARKIDKPCIDLIPLENFRIDPGSNWADPIASSPYLIHMLPMRVMDVRARMKDEDPTTTQPRWKTLNDAQLMAGKKSYSDSTRMTRERNRTDSTDTTSAIRDFDIVWVHRNIMDIDGKDVVFYTLGTHALLSDPVPLEQVYWHEKRPYTWGYCVIETHKVYNDGVTGLTRDTQAEINEIANQRIDNVKFAMNKRYFAMRGRQVDIRSLTRNVPGSVTMMQGIEDVKIIDTPDVTASAYTEQDRLNLDFDDVAGAFSQSSVQSNRNLNETVGGMQMLNATTNQVGAYQLRTFVETWVEPVLQKLILLEAKYETDEVILKLARKAAKLEQYFAGQAMDEGFMDELLEMDVSMNVNVGTGSTNPMDQIKSFLDAMRSLRDMLADGVLEKFGLDVAEVIKEIFGKLGYRDGDRFFDSENEDPALTNAKATIQQLQQELEQKVSPEMVAAQVRKLDAEIEGLGAKTRDMVAKTFETNVKGMFASGQLAQMLASVPQMASVADEIVKAAGYQAPDPVGIDPNFPVLDEAAAGLVQNSVKDPRTGVEFMPGGAVAGDTSPLTPANPATGVEGVNQGIETVRADS